MLPVHYVREASDPGTCQLSRRHLSQDTVCNKTPILQLASPEVRNALLHVGDVCHIAFRLRDLSQQRGMTIKLDSIPIQ